jgi:chitin disaccharide deacetylase
MNSLQPMKQLLTRADDFGASLGTNDAIVEAARAGLVRNVGVMAPGPCPGHRLGELLALRGRICIGLHATLNSEWAGPRWGPLAGIGLTPGLARGDGTFHADVEQTHRFAEPEEGVREVRAQLDHLRSRGLDPEYVDCHMAFNWHPDWDRALGEFAAQEGLRYHAHGMLPAVRLEIRGPGDPGPADLRRFMDDEHLERALWVFHPARRDSASERFFKDPQNPSTHVAEIRDREYRFLADERSVSAFLSCDGIRLIRYDELLDRKGARMAFSRQHA